jgi:hypothetical protein
MKSLQMIAVLLVVVGALNWGLVGLLGINVVSSVLGAGSIFERIVYILVGLAGVVVAWNEWGSK